MAQIDPDFPDVGDQAWGGPLNAVLGLIAQQGNASDKAVSAMPTLSIREFDVDPTGVLDVRAVMQDALATAVSAGRRLAIPDGDYKLDTALTLPAGARTAAIVASPGARFIQGKQQPLIDAACSFGEIFSDTSFSEADENTSEYGGDSDTILVTTLTLATGSAPAYVLGDRLRLIADDLIPGARPETGTDQRRVGYDFIVLSCVGNKVKVFGGMPLPSDAPFTTNVRVARFGNENFSLQGGTYDTLSTKSKGGLIRLTGFTGARVSDIRVVKAGNFVIQLQGNFMSTVDNVIARFATNNPGTGNPGYLVSDNSSSYCQYTRLDGHGVRHTWTDDTSKSAENVTDLEGFARHGSTRGAMVSNVIGRSNLSEVLSPHSAGRDCVFENILAMDSRGGVTHRGIGHTYRNVRAVRCKRGFAAFSETGTATETRNFLVDGMRITDSTENDIRIRKNYDGPNAGQRVSTQDKILNLVIEGAGPDSIYLQNASLLLSDATIYSRSTMPSGSRYIEKDNTTLRIAGALTFNLGGLVGGTDISLIHHSATSGDAGTVRGGCIQVFGGTAELERLGYVDSGLSSHQIETSVYLESAIARTRISGSRGASSLLKFTMGRGSDPDLSSAWVPLPNAFIGTASSDDWVRMMDEPVVTYAIEATSAGAVLHAMGAPNREGVIRHLFNAGSLPVTVKHGSAYGTNLQPNGDGTSDKVIQPGGRIQVQWVKTAVAGSTAAWRQFA